ncbi:Threonylcarbamoyl-AMP synthase [Wickerhamiella sorbophila]|uniref:Threonylcarbamoyl-AMP synthase n=1 Tax=Wickerhamiella sorbophila TaxID=45607 RepID=A0A2T0FDC3_9ASCO|nr:Threonylcarbamoyl-AMP synthase [Wickerhamiella sorbophila]PRT53002.1 Threonylcarbamoyl-AMP synthase [Wickerhamiella sorbophila]
MTAVLKVDPLKITFDGIHARIAPSKTLDNLRIAVDALKKDQVVAFPTETVYGLGASCQSTPGVQGIYAAKNRPADNPLIIHVSSREQLETTLLQSVPSPKIPPIYVPLIEKFWPGPLTILLPLPENTTISPVCTLGQSTFGVRVPANPIARALIEMSNLPLAAPSANASTKPSCTTAQHVFNDMRDRIPFIIDGGPADIGVESTVVDGLVSPPQILRPGGVTLEQIREIGGSAWKNVVIAKPNAKENEKVRTPGMKYRHYSPQAYVTVFQPGAEHKLVDFVRNRKATKVAYLRSKTFPKSAFAGLENVQVYDMPLGTTNKDISHNLFNYFREADSLGVDLIIVEGIDVTEEGLAIMNRIHKAAGEIVEAI